MLNRRPLAVFLGSWCRVLKLAGKLLEGTNANAVEEAVAIAVFRGLATTS